MSLQLKVRVKGLPEVLAKLDKREYLLNPIRTAFVKSTLVVEREVKDRVPRDTAELQRSIVRDIDPSPVPTWGVVGSNLKYVRPVEFGSGILSDSPLSKHQRYFPPGPALAGWAVRHGFKKEGMTDVDAGWVVARAIFRRGGTKPVRMFREGFKAAKKQIELFFSLAARVIEDNWRRR